MSRRAETEMRMGQKITERSDLQFLYRTSIEPAAGPRSNRAFCGGRETSRVSCYVGTIAKFRIGGLRTKLIEI